MKFSHCGNFYSLLGPQNGVKSESICNPCLVRVPIVGRISYPCGFSLCLCIFSSPQMFPTLAVFPYSMISVDRRLHRWGLKHSVCAVRLFGHVAILETHTL